MSHCTSIYEELARWPSHTTHSRDKHHEFRPKTCSKLGQALISDPRLWWNFSVSTQTWLFFTYRTGTKALRFGLNEGKNMNKMWLLAPCYWESPWDVMGFLTGGILEYFTANDSLTILYLWIQVASSISLARPNVPFKKLVRRSVQTSRTETYHFQVRSDGGTSCPNGWIWAGWIYERSL